MNAWYDAALPDDARAMAHLSAFLATTPDFGLSSSLTTQSSSPSSDDDSAIQAKKHARPKHEIEILHAKHNELQRQLQLLQLLRAPPKPVTPWQARAMRQAEAAQRTLQENSRLKRLVSDQRKVLSALERSLRKCPRLESPSPSYAEDTTLFQHLLQQQFDKMESEWIQRRLYDASAPLRHTTLERSPEDGAIASFRFVAKMSAPLDYKSMAQVFWTHKTGLLGPSCSVHRTIDHNIVYMRELARYADLGVPVMETHDCFGRFLEPSRVVMVWRSLGQGETITPHGADHLVGHRWGWLVIEESSAFECSVQCSMTTRLPTFPASASATEVATWTDRLVQSSRTSKDALGAVVQAAVLERREHLGLSNRDASLQNTQHRVTIEKRPISSSRLTYE